MNTFLFWQRWLFAVGLIIVVFGILMALFSGTALFALFDSQVNPVFWNGGDLPLGVQAFQRWIYGVLGATMAGWGVFLAYVAYYPFKGQEKWAWNCVLFGMLLWFVSDTFISWQSGVYFNVLFNTLVFVLALLPLVFTRTYMGERLQER